MCCIFVFFIIWPFLFLAAPLAPESFSLNITKEGYDLNWNIINTPGRPSFQKIDIQYRHANSSNSWKIFKLPRNTRKRRAIVNSDGIFINAKDITDERHPLEFQIFAVAANGAISAAKKPDPDLIIINGKLGCWKLPLSIYFNYYVKLNQINLKVLSKKLSSVSILLNMQNYVIPYLCS